MFVELVNSVLKSFPLKYKKQLNNVDVITNSPKSSS